MTAIFQEIDIDIVISMYDTSAIQLLTHLNLSYFSWGMDLRGITYFVVSGAARCFAFINSFFF